jgi:hypothetical protein
VDRIWPVYVTLLRLSNGAADLSQTAGPEGSWKMLSLSEVTTIMLASLSHSPKHFGRFLRNHNQWHGEFLRPSKDVRKEIGQPSQYGQL